MSASSPVTNVFTSANAAERYVAGRPSLHRRILAAARPHLAPSPPFHHALDVACGTGHSTVALLDLSARVTGVDQSEAMMQVAPRPSGVAYTVARAEELPFADASFDLVTIASAFHWVDQPRFLHESARVLVHGGQLIIYNSGSTGDLDHPGWRPWFDQVFYERFPKVARHAGRAEVAAAQVHGLTLMVDERFPHEQEHTLDGYVELLLTRSNLIQAIDSGGVAEDEARVWIRAGLAPFIPPGETRTLRHCGGYQVFRRH